MRTFIAIGLPLNLRRKLDRISQDLRRKCSGVKWVDPEKIHLTLKFLGNVEVEKLPRIKAVLDEVTRHHCPIKVEVGGLGCFPNLRRPRVIWVGIKNQEEKLGKLAKDIEDKLAELGFQPEKRKFNGHLTLGRVKKFPVKLNLNIPSLEARAESLGSLNIDMILLIKSTLTARGAVYDIISEHKLEPSA